MADSVLWSGGTVALLLRFVEEVDYEPLRHIANLRSAQSDFTGFSVAVVSATSKTITQRMSRCCHNTNRQENVSQSSIERTEMTLNTSIQCGP